MTPRSLIVLDLDDTLTRDRKDVPYAEKPPREPIHAAARAAEARGYGLLVSTARNMRSFQGDLERIRTHTLPLARAWIARHGLAPEDVLGGKPWAGPRGFYVDDRAMHLEEFVWRFTGPLAHAQVAVHADRTPDGEAHEAAQRLERWLHVVAYRYPDGPLPPEAAEDPLVGAEAPDDAWTLRYDPTQARLLAPAMALAAAVLERARGIVAGRPGQPDVLRLSPPGGACPDPLRLLLPEASR
jgi:capsule biosynthesis phosphatase